MPRVSLHDALCWIVSGDDGPRYTSTSSRGSDDSTEWDEAEQQLIAYLRENKLKARGRKGGIGEPRDIPEDFWHGNALVLLPTEDFSAALHEFDPSRDEWREITLEFYEVRRLWLFKGTSSEQKPVHLVADTPASRADTLIPDFDDRSITKSVSESEMD